MVLDTVTCPCLAPALPSKVRGCTWGEKGQVLLRMDTVVEGAGRHHWKPSCSLLSWVFDLLVAKELFGESPSPSTSCQHCPGCR